jgi:hypothetical protein
MRQASSRSSVATVVMTGLVVAGCMDSPITAPDAGLEEPAHDLQASLPPTWKWVGVGIATGGGPPPPCDDDVVIIECDDGSGGGGGSSDEVPLCPDCTSLAAWRLQSLQNATPNICTSHRAAVQAALTNGQFGQRTSSYPIRGWHHSGYHTGSSSFHYSINTTHPGWTSGSLTPTQKAIELAGTLVHEYFHHTYPNEDHYPSSAGPGIDDRTQQCVPGYQGP